MNMLSTIGNDSSIDVRRNLHRRFFTGALATLLVLCAGPSSADIAGAFVKVEKLVHCSFEQDNFPGANFSTVIPAEAKGSGFLMSFAQHGNPSLDIKDFPTDPVLTSATGVVGDSENSSQKVYYVVLPTAITLFDNTMSNSEAASLNSMGHLSTSYSATSAMKTLSVTRTTTGVLETSPVFGILVNSPDRAFHLKAFKEGDASADCTVNLDLVGKIRNTSIAEQPLEDLVPKRLISKTIQANDEWFSPTVSDIFSLALPDWTRLSGAKFDLSLGLRLQMWSRAEVNAVPEPAQWLTICGGIFALATVRRKRKTGKLPSQK